MGSLCSACKKLQADGEEEKPLLPAHQSEPEAPVLEETSEMRSAKYYQNVIDDANGKFITTLRYRNRVSANTDEMRYKLQSAVVDESLILSPPTANLFQAKPGNGSNKTSLSTVNVDHNNKTITQILNEPVIISDKLDSGTDEIAGIVSTWMSANTLNSRVGGEENGDEEMGIVVNLKPV
jgi:hypothetical protein